MVLFRGPNPIGPSNRDERGAYEEMQERHHKYMMMEDNEWNELYQKMYNDRKYPGRDSLKLMVIPSLAYAGIGAAFSFELYLRRANLFAHSTNIFKLFMIPLFGALTFRNLDIASDIIRYRKKYPEMYQT